MIAKQAHCVTHKKQTVFVPNDEIQSNSDLACGSQIDFIVVNRSPEHVKQATLDYFKENKMPSLAKAIREDEWEDYNDVALAQRHYKKKKKRVVKSRKKTGRKTQKPQRSFGKINGMFKWPLKKKSFWMSSFFGPRKKKSGKWGFHYGIDMAALRGTPVYAAKSGTVVDARNASKGYGNMVMIAHDSTYTTRYAHLDSIKTKKGARVKVGDVIGTVGDTGFTIKSGKDASHLHFEVIQRGKQVNPLDFLSKM